MRVTATGGFNNPNDLANAINNIIEKLEEEGREVINIKYAISALSGNIYATESHYALILFK
ncbi:hypothetical protein DB313_05385 (plasmid) [Borrelia turcica IST7]|uniref:Uncharacterized protein n=1 Tax=Borrelia turcica IST7 TaxID=1104446 RepID=A0A386PPT6_9SPIR|nr:hypothetical protein [Borrelia turcica]AYE36933.1 hypothetical protein DB313_05385 [Borrelia turcica IST7]